MSLPGGFELFVPIIVAVLLAVAVVVALRR